MEGRVEEKTLVVGGGQEKEGENPKGGKFRFIGK